MNVAWAGFRLEIAILIVLLYFFILEGVLMFKSVFKCQRIRSFMRGILIGIGSCAIIMIVIAVISYIV